MKVSEIVEGYNVPGVGGGTGGGSNATVAPAAQQQRQQPQQQAAPNNNAQQIKGAKLKTKDGKEINLDDNDINVELHADGTVDVYKGEKQ